MKAEEKKEFYLSAGASFAHKLEVMSNSPANARTKEVLEMAIEDRRKKIPKEYLEYFEQGLKAR